MATFRPARIICMKVWAIGTYVKFNKQPDETWSFLPGASKHPKSNRQARWFIGMWEPEKVLKLIEDGVFIDKRDYLNLDREIVVVYRTSYKRAQYKNGSNKLTLQPFRACVEKLEMEQRWVN
jgi:hypothetical protein